MVDVGSRLTALASFILKVLFVLVVLRAVTSALGLLDNTYVPVLDDILKFSFNLMKLMSEGFEKFMGKRLSFA